MDMTTDPSATSLSIADVADRTGVSAHTLRYYERIGLIGSVGRSASGHRRYAVGDVDWIRLLSCLRQTGMGIRDLQRFVVTAGGEVATARARLAVMETHAAEVRERKLRVEESLRLIEWKIGRYREIVHAADEHEPGEARGQEDTQ